MTDLEIREFIPSGYAKTDKYPHGAPARIAGVKAQYTDYEHYGDNPADETQHTDRAWMVSSVFSVCEVYCQCGKWAAGADVYMHSVRDVEPFLIERHERHIENSLLALSKGSDT